MSSRRLAVSAVHPSSSERILTTALDLFAVRGYDATSVREICEAAGITKPTLYHFYGSKDGVLRALVSAGFDQFRAIVDQGLASPGSFRERLKVITRAVFGAARTQPLLWRFIHGVIWAPPGTTEPPNCTEFYDGVVGSLAAAAEAAVARGEFAAGPIDVRMLIVMGAISEAATGYVISGRPELTPELADRLVDTIVDGWAVDRLR
jgi:TetR/AcrR family transcriptional regulator